MMRVRAVLSLVALLALAGCSGGSDDASQEALPADLCAAVGTALSQGWQVAAATTTDDEVTCQGHGGTTTLRLDVRRGTDATPSTDPLEADRSSGSVLAETTIDRPTGWTAGTATTLSSTAPGQVAQRVHTAASFTGGGWSLTIELLGPAIAPGDLSTRLDADKRVVQVAGENVWDQLAQ
jgi:hypothetical protein